MSALHEGINRTVIEQKSDVRRKLEEDMERFLAAGGKTTVVAAGASGSSENWKDFTINGERDAARIAGFKKDDKAKTTPAAAPKKIHQPKAPIDAPDIRREVQMGFKKKGATLQQWCQQEGIHPARASGVLKCCKGKKSAELRQRILDGLTALPEPEEKPEEAAAPAATHEAPPASTTMDLRQVLRWWLDEENSKDRSIYVNRDRFMAALVTQDHPGAKP